MGAHSNKLLSNDIASDWIAEVYHKNNVDRYIKSALEDFVEAGKGIDVDADEFEEAVNEFSEYLLAEISAGRKIFNDSGDLLKDIKEIREYSHDKIIDEYENSIDHCYIAIAAMETLVAFFGMPSAEFTELTPPIISIDERMENSEFNKRLTVLVELALIVHGMFLNDPFYERCLIFDKESFDNLGKKLLKISTQ